MEELENHIRRMIERLPDTRYHLTTARLLDYIGFNELPSLYRKKIENIIFKVSASKMNRMLSAANRIAENKYRNIMMQAFKHLINEGKDPSQVESIPRYEKYDEESK